MPGFGGQRAAGVDLEVLGPCRIPGRLYLVDSEDHPGKLAPALVMGEGEVEGVLLSVPDRSTLAAIDRYEGWDPNNHSFCRTVRRSVDLIEPQVRVFAYLCPHRRRREALDMSWAEYCRREAHRLA